MLDSLCEGAVRDGSLACTVYDTVSGDRVAGVERVSVDGRSVLGVLMGRTRVSNLFARDDAPASGEVSHELLVVGAAGMTFACVTTQRRSMVILVVPMEMSVALGWSLLRRVAAVAEVAR